MPTLLSPVFNDMQFTNAGTPAVGYKVFTYLAGTTTKTPVFTDLDGLVPHTNPIVLNARGESPSAIRLVMGTAYKFVFTSDTDGDPPTSPIRTIDDVKGINDVVQVTPTVSQWVVTGLVPTFSSSTSFTVPGNQTSVYEPGRKTRATVSTGFSYGTVQSSVFTTSTLVTLVTDPGSNVLDTGLTSVDVGLPTGAFNAVPDDSEDQYVADTSGTPNVITVAPLVPVKAYSTGLRIRAKLNTTNTGPTTMAVSGLAAKNVLRQLGFALASGELESGKIEDFTYDGTQFILGRVRSGLIDVQVFIVSGTWTRVSGTKAIEVFLVGGGGAGSNVSSSDPTTAGIGGGGGGGGAAWGYFTTGFGSSESVTIGAGGVSGGTGGTSLFGTLLTAFGGASGATSNNSPTDTVASGGLGGSASASGGLTIGITGTPGGAGFISRDDGVSPFRFVCFSGFGGVASIYGTGGRGQTLIDTQVAASVNGLAGAQGGGGSGAIAVRNTTGTGGAGGAGICVVHSYAF